ncbi:MAG TPA: hypothetical protein PLR02_12715 [Rhodocyclaceae bacterium]|nr:hypothetical protein [Rhodocyclaceae bacterium]
MTQDKSANDPLDFVRGMWNNMGFSLPGMVAPTLDIDELDKRITDMKAVENWLKMNTSMLQMTIQGLEMQRAALAAVKAMSQQPADGKAAAPAGSEANPFAQAAMWPWNFMAGQQAAGGGDRESATDESKARARAVRKPAATGDK